MKNNNLYFKRAEEIKEDIFNYRHHIHQNPELGLETKNTAEYIAERLKEMGYKPEIIKGCGVTATVGKDNGKVILLRADIDALPLTEESGLDFASVNPGAAHCCGHDLHAAMLLGAAKLLKEQEDSLDGMVKLMFQPGEETLMGARTMIDAGILENPKVDAAIGMHVFSAAPCGNIYVLSGAVGTSSDIFTIKIKGKGGHGASPERTIDPLNIASHIHIALQELQAREVPSGETGVLTIGCINGGSACNVIPDEAYMMGTIRTFNNDIRELLINRLNEISVGTAKVFRGEAEVEFSEEYTIPLVSNPQMAEIVTMELKKAYNPDLVFKMGKSLPASEDFAFIADKVPSLFIILGAGAENGEIYQHHHPKVIFNDNCLPIGAAAYAFTASEWLKNN